MANESRPPSRHAVINVVGLTPRWLGRDLPAITRFVERQENVLLRIRPPLPAVTSTVQATFLTGLNPGQHGIVANGWYDRERAEHLFWKQSDHLVQGARLWEAMRQDYPGFTCARLFWWNNMFSTVDYSITPRPIYGADGKKTFDITSHPLEIRDEIKSDLGDFPFPAFWGPGAGIESSRWIAESAQWIEARHQPDLSLIYLPHLDYNLQKLGPDDFSLGVDLQAIDEVTGQLIDFLQDRGVQPVLVSEYGITPVERPVHLNRVFRKRGWLEVKEELGREILELGASRAFAIADHQIAHVYVNDASLLQAVAEELRSTPGVGEVLDAEGKRRAGLDHPRAGDLVAVADASSWFTYYFWEDDERAPDYARTVDIHRKPGYDPVELFIDPAIRFPKLKVGWKLARKALGFRMLMDVIPLDADLVRGSHGRIPEDEADWPMWIGPVHRDVPDGRVEATAVFGLLRETMLSGKAAD